LSVGFSTGFSGTLSKLSRAGDEWRGTTESRTDQLGAQRYRRSMRLKPVDCDAPPIEPASLDPPLLRRIPLANGDILELGAHLPTGIALSPRRTGAWNADVAAGGLWAGHDTVVVRLDRERTVHHISLRYPETFDLSAIADSLRRAYPPERYGGREWSWVNRTSRLWLSFGPRPSVTILDPRYH
jgi:hypothetical protein